LTLRQHLAPLLALAALVCVYFVPQLATGTVQYDGVDVHYSSQRYFSDAIRGGHLPFWTPFLFAGFPFLADLQVGAWYPLNWLFFVLGITPSSMSFELLVHTLIACGGAYVLGVRLLGQSVAAVAVGMFYGLSGYFAAHSQHVGMVETAAWLPWLVLVLLGLGERLSLRRLALAALLGAALALPGHFQLALYAFSGAAVWALLEAGLSRSMGTLRRMIIGLLAVGVGGALLSAVMILPAAELVGLSVRTLVNAHDSDLGYFHPRSLLTLVWPDSYGLLSGQYSGPGDVTQHYFYAGTLLVLLVILGLGHRPSLRMALLLGVPFVWYAIGPPGGLFRIVARLPGFSSVELPMHGWFLPTLGLALLGGAGLLRVAPRLRMVILGVVFIDVLFFNQLQNPLAFSRQSFAELYGEPLRTFQAAVSAAPGFVRVYGSPLTAVGYRNHPLQSRVETTYGYNPLELVRYAEYADAAESNRRLVDGLAATHVLSADHAIQSNPTALPRVYFARRVTFLADDAATQSALFELDPSEETLVTGPPRALESDPSASATVIDRGEDHLTIHYRSTSAANLLRVAIPTYPGWHATLNGADLTILTVDHAFVGVVLPAGEGDITLSYTSRYFFLGTLVSSIAVFITGAALVRRGPPLMKPSTGEVQGE
jgi:hypothetical protein